MLFHTYTFVPRQHQLFLMILGQSKGFKNYENIIVILQKEHGSLPNHIARTLTARRICLGGSKCPILI